MIPVDIKEANDAILSARLACMKEKADLFLSQVEGIKNGLTECCKSTCIAVNIKSGEFEGQYFLKFSGLYFGFPEFSGDGMTIKGIEIDGRYYYEIRVNNIYVARSLDELNAVTKPTDVKVWINGDVFGAEVNINFCYGGDTPEPPVPPVEECNYPNSVYLTSTCVDYPFTDLEMIKIAYNNPGYKITGFVNIELDLILVFNTITGNYELLKFSTNELVADAVAGEDVCDLPSSYIFRTEACNEQPINILDCPAITDPDAISYIAAAEIANGASAICAFKIAIEDLILEIKAGGEWDNLDYLHVYAGWDTLAAANIPILSRMAGLAGIQAPTLHNIVLADYNKKLGIKGNASNKYITHEWGTNGAVFNPLFDRRENHQLWSFITEPNSNLAVEEPIITATESSINSGVRIRQTGTGQTSFHSWQNTTFNNLPVDVLFGFVGISRDNTANYKARHLSNTTTRVWPTSSTTLSANNTRSLRELSNYSDQRIFAVGAGRGWAGDGSVLENAIQNYLDKLALIFV